MKATKEPSVLRLALCRVEGTSCPCRLAWLRVVLARVVPPRLVPGVEPAPVVSSWLLSTVFCPVAELSAVVTLVL